MSKKIRKRRVTSLTAEQDKNYLMITFNEAKNYVIQGKKIEGVRERTLTDYEKTWKYFTDWLFNNCDYEYINDLTTNDFRNYINYMKYDKKKYSGHKYINSNEQETGLSDTTINIQLRTLKAHFNYLYREKLINFNPIDSIKLIKQDTDEYNKGFTNEELKAIFQQPYQREYVGFRDYIAMTLLLDTGLRVGSLLSLREQNIDFITRFITVDSQDVKTRRSLLIPFSKHTSKLLLQLVQENKANFKTDRIFLSSYGEPLGQNQFNKRLKHYAEQANIDTKKKRCTAHAYRHTWATNMLKNGCDIHTLQKIGGWSDIRTMQRYLNLNAEDIKRSHEEFSPINLISNKRTK